MSGDGGGDGAVRFGLAVSLFDYYRDDHPWRSKAITEVTIGDVVKEFAIAGNSRSTVRMTMQFTANMIKNLSSSAGSNRNSVDSSATRAKEQLSHPARAKEWLRDEVVRLSKDPVTEQMTAMKLDSLLASLSRFHSVYRDAGDDALLQDIVVATQTIRGIAERNLAKALERVQPELAKFLQSLPRDLERFNWTPGSVPPPTIAGTTLLSPPRFLVAYRRQASMVADTISAFKVPDLNSLLEIRRVLGHHPALTSTPIVVQALEKLKPSALLSRDKLVYLVHTFFRSRLGYIAKRLATSPVKFTAFGTQQGVVHTWATKNGSLFERLFAPSASDSVVLPMTLPHYKEGEVKLTITTKEEFNRHKDMFWTALDEVKQIKTKMPAEWPITISNLMHPDETGPNAELVVEEAGFTSIMAAYADLYVVLKTLFSNWTHATDSMNYLVDLYAQLDSAATRKVAGPASSASPASVASPRAQPTSLQQQQQQEEAIRSQIEELRPKLANLQHRTPKVETAVDDDVLVPYLRKYLSKELAHENLDFVRAANAFMRTPASFLMDSAIKIYDRYFKDGAQQQLNVADTTRQLIRRTLEQQQVRADMFNTARSEAIAMLIAPFSRFMQSQQYLDFIKDQLSQAQRSPGLPTNNSSQQLLVGAQPPREPLPMPSPKVAQQQQSPTPTRLSTVAAAPAKPRTASNALPPPPAPVAAVQAQPQSTRPQPQAQPQAAPTADLNNMNNDDFFRMLNDQTDIDFLVDQVAADAAEGAPAYNSPAAAPQVATNEWDDVDLGDQQYYQEPAPGTNLDMRSGLAFESLEEIEALGAYGAADQRQQPAPVRVAAAKPLPAPTSNSSQPQNASALDDLDSAEFDVNEALAGLEDLQESMGFGQELDDLNNPFF